MTRHGKNCTAGAVYTYHEKRKDTGELQTAAASVGYMCLNRQIIIIYYGVRLSIHLMSFAYPKSGCAVNWSLKGYPDIPLPAEPPQLTPFSVQEHRLCSETPPDERAPQPVSN
ncbi:hypothetical protein XENOCAPTIV_008764 [Xenoophorus captivus]|uniref:Nitric oxide synthase-interacting protein zinc-finger domain-containing protein n=1 Tax=Xenoophorus captivus TaxID=1517983 RepID=A0ABV0S5X4_9TELE